VDDYKRVLFPEYGISLPLVVLPWSTSRDEDEPQREVLAQLAAHWHRGDLPVSVSTDNNLSVARFERRFILYPDGRLEIRFYGRLEIRSYREKSDIYIGMSRDASGRAFGSIVIEDAVKGL
jgi:hypothetical protein